MLSAYGPVYQTIRYVMYNVNTQNRYIPFTMGIEANHTLNFLEVSIDHKTDKFGFSIFWKYTFTDTSNSFGTFNTKF